MHGISIHTETSTSATFFDGYFGVASSEESKSERRIRLSLKYPLSPLSLYRRLLQEYSIDNCWASAHAVYWNNAAAKLQHFFQFTSRFVKKNPKSCNILEIPITFGGFCNYLKPDRLDAFEGAD